VRYLKNTEIDREKWDGCIENSVFETLYPYSWYLDLVNPGWDALVRGDYEMVMPLTITRKIGFSLLLQPILSQQLGMFSASPTSEIDILEFLTEIFHRFRYIDICLNKENKVPRESINIKERGNYELDLGSGPVYNSNTKRNLQKGRANAFEFREIAIQDYLDLKFSPGEEIGVDRGYMENLFGGLAERDRGQAFGLFLENRLQAAAVLGYARTRVIYMNGCSSPTGKETRAMFVLMDYLIGHSIGKAPVFDFEGSEIPGVARFFEGFGGVKTAYHRIIQKRFPFTLMKG